MKRSFFIIALVFITLMVHSQTDCDIKNYYGDFIKVEKKKSKMNGSEFLIKHCVPVKNNNCIADLINNSIRNHDNFTYLEYLLTNFCSSCNNKDLVSITDSIALQNEFVRSLQNDSSFNSIMSEFAAKTIGKGQLKDTVTMDKLVNIAVKYFTITRITDDGYYVGKVCAGINGISSTQKVRQPQIEAFCFSTIMNNYSNGEINMYDEFVIAIKDLYKIDLGVDNNERLLRAQGAMFFLMRNNENLKKLLIREYEVHKDYLPFILYYTS